MILITTAYNFTINPGQTITLTVPDADLFYGVIAFEPRSVGQSFFNYGTIELTSNYSNTNDYGIAIDGTSLNNGEVVENDGTIRVIAPQSYYVRGIVVGGWSPQIINATSGTIIVQGDLATGIISGDSTKPL